MSLEHPYQHSSLRCSEGRGGKIVKSIHHVVGILKKLVAKLIIIMRLFHGLLPHFSHMLVRTQS